MTSSKENFLLNFGSLDNLSLFNETLPTLIKRDLLSQHDIVVCNILANVIKTLIPYFNECINIKGYLILSGILKSQAQEIIKILNLYNFKIDNVSSKKDWICIKAFK